MRGDSTLLVQTGWVLPEPQSVERAKEDSLRFFVFIEVSDRYINFKYNMKRLKKFFLLIITLISLGACVDEPKPTPVPKKSTPQPIPSKNTAVNVFVENSGSMFGYIQTGGKYNPSTDFAATLSNYMTKLVLSDFVVADSLKLHYINSEIFVQSVLPTDFIKNLTVHTAKTWGSDLTTTDMSTLFNMVMENTGQNEVSIFVSDCIFSPQKGVDATNYLVSQKNAISYAVKANSKKNLTYGSNCRMR